MAAAVKPWSEMTFAEQMASAMQPQDQASDADTVPNTGLQSMNLLQSNPADMLNAGQSAATPPSSTLESAGTGALSGSALGPIGSLIGGGLGAIGSFLNAGQENKLQEQAEADRQKELQLMYDQFGLQKKTQEQANAVEGMNFLKNSNRATKAL
jgi:hypothetical protein